MTHNENIKFNRSMSTLRDILHKSINSNVILILSAITQCMSMPFSFLSLTLASVKLFYSQRLGRFPDVDPSPALVAFVFPFVMVQITGNVLHV
jgi:hypothetical protein